MAKFNIDRYFQEEVELEIPAYFKSGGCECHYFKVYSDEKCLMVCVSKGMETIRNAHAQLAWSDNSIRCTQEEFETAFLNTASALINISKLD